MQMAGQDWVQINSANNFTDSGSTEDGEFERPGCSAVAVAKLGHERWHLVKGHGRPMLHRSHLGALR